MHHPVACPACGREASPAPGQLVPCPGCGLLVAAPVPTRSYHALALRLTAAGAALMLGAAGAAYFYQKARHAEEQRERASRREALRAREAIEREEARATAARLRALAAVFPVPLDPLPAAEAERRTRDLGAKLVGVWRGPGASGGVREIEYAPDGTFRDTAPGRAWHGRWAADGLHGTRVLRVARGGAGPAVVRLTFEGEELVHDDEPGTATVLRRQPPAP